MAEKYETIEAFGLKTRVWTLKEPYGYGCAECCTGDRCDDDDCNSTNTPYHGRRKQCPHCKGAGWIKKEDITVREQKETTELSNWNKPHVIKSEAAVCPKCGNTNDCWYLDDRRIISCNACCWIGRTVL